MHVYKIAELETISHDYIVEIVNRHTGAVICEQLVFALDRRDACQLAMSQRSYRDFEAGYVYQEE